MSLMAKVAKPWKFVDIDTLPYKYMIKDNVHQPEFDYPIWLFKRPMDYFGPLGIVKVPKARAPYLLGLTAKAHRGGVTTEPLLAQPLSVGRNNFKPIVDVTVRVFIVKNNSTLTVYKSDPRKLTRNRRVQMSSVTTRNPDFVPRKKCKQKDKTTNEQQ